jgi:hypothetical protein
MGWVRSPVTPLSDGSEGENDDFHRLFQGDKYLISIGYAKKCGKK